MTKKTKHIIKLALIRRYVTAKQEAIMAVEQSDRDYWDNEKNEIVEAYAEFDDLPIRISKEILDKCK